MERFIIYKCDSLRPVLVSDSLPSTLISKSKKSSSLLNYSERGERMHSATSDTTLDITFTTHSHSSKRLATHATLYKRTKPIQTLKVIEQNHKENWGIVQALSLGRGKYPVANDNSDESNETSEANAHIFALVCARDRGDEDNDDNIDILGDSDDDSMDDSSSSKSSVSSDESILSDYYGEIVILLVARNSMYIQKRIMLKTLPDFKPTVAIHPHTYLNKILIGGYDGDLLLLNVRSKKVIHEFKCLTHLQRSKITVLEQSPAVDTIAIGTTSGCVHLVNIRMDVLLFTLHHDGIKNGKSPEITSISFRTDASTLEYGIAPMAVGQSNGRISVWDITPRSDDLDDNNGLSTLNQSKARRTLLWQVDGVHPGGVSKLSYFPQEPLLLSAGIKSNNLIMHIFDNPNHSGRILKQRSGHVAPPRVLMYQHANSGVLASMSDGTDAASCQILSCGGKGDSSLRIFSTARSVLDREFSQGKGLLKKSRDFGLEDKSEILLKPIIGMAMCETKSRDWGDLVTIHKDHSFAYVWSTKSKSQSGPILRQEGWNISAMKVQPPKGTHATAVTMSSCGNFAIIGTREGVIYKYNVQSGLARGSFPREASSNGDARKKKTLGAGNIHRTTKLLERSLKIHKTHTTISEEKLKAEELLTHQLNHARHNDAEVTGLVVDALNKTLLSVGSDSKLILWSFPTHAPHRRSPIILPSPATKLVHARDSGLVAIALQDFSVIMFDMLCLSIVRKFGSAVSKVRHSGPISDLAFGPDGRKLLTTSLDGTLCVWDVPTSSCVDWLTFSTPPLSLTLSSTGEFLATAHMGRLGISLWCDRSFFQTVHLDGTNPPKEPIQMDEPSIVVEDEDPSHSALTSLTSNNVFQTSSNKVSDNETDDISLEEESPTPKDNGLITLSGIPAGKWKNLFHLELIKERNKPKEAPEKPPSAPFFLQWRSGESMNTNDPLSENKKQSETDKDGDDDWEAAWIDDEGEEPAHDDDDDDDQIKKSSNKRKQEEDSDKGATFDINKKRKKTTLFRSELATLLEKCFVSYSNKQTNNFDLVTQHLFAMGPAAIDVAFGSLCHGLHDLDEGLHLLYLATLWLIEACKSRKDYDIINAYLHRFLHIHSVVISGIDTAPNIQELIESNGDIHIEAKTVLLESISELRRAHRLASEQIRNKMQQSLSLLRHFSRMV